MESRKWSMTCGVPCPELLDRVAGYIDYWEAGGRVSSRREPTATRSVLLINTGAAIELVGPNMKRIRIVAGEGFIAGMSQVPWQSRSSGTQSGLVVQASAASLAELSGRSPASLFDQILHLDEALGSRSHDLGKAILQARTSHARFDLMDAFLRDAGLSVVDPSMSRAATILREAPQSQITEVARELGFDRRDFARRFYRTHGVSPRLFRRLARFEAFAETLHRSSGQSIAGTALEAGYFDQAHLNRETVNLTGLTPAQLRAKRLPNKGGYRDSFGP